MPDTPATRGFHPKRQDSVISARVPPGQYVTPDFPVLSAGPTPRTRLEEWTLAVQVGGKIVKKWSWKEFEQLPQTTLKTDIHCVTKWSKLDTTWQGVSFDTLLAAAGMTSLPTDYLMAHCDGAYTTNIPVADLLDGRSLIATAYAGLPLLPDHGGPARLLVPHLYFWKSAKWVRRLRFMEKDEPGFWEGRGYHNHGDPWKEQRYEGD